MSDWPRVPLGDLLTQVVDGHRVHADWEYPNFGIYSFGRGLFHKPPISGATTSATTLYRARKGQFIYSRLFAFEGAYGVVDEAFDGYFVSNEYPMFHVHPERLLPRYLAAYLKLPRVWEAVAHLASGMGDRRQRIQPEQFLKHFIPLPPLPEQRRLVARIDTVFEKVTAALSLRSRVELEVEALLNCTRRNLIGETPGPDWNPLRSIVDEIENGWSPSCGGRRGSDTEWAVLKVGAVSYGVYDPNEHKVLPAGLDSRPELEVQAGDFLMSRANTYELVGACAVVDKTPPRLMLSDKHFRFKFRNPSIVNLEYLDHVLKSPALRKQIVEGATGTSPTMKNISKEKVLSLLIPSHTPEQQLQIAETVRDVTGRIRSLQVLQKQVATEMEGLIPSLLDRAFQGKL